MGAEKRGERLDVETRGSREMQKEREKQRRDEQRGKERTLKGREGSNPSVGETEIERERRHGGCVQHTVHRTSQSRMVVEKREGGEG